MTVPDLDRRAQALAKCIYRATGQLIGQTEAADILKQVYPELFTDPPHWLAPWEASEKIHKIQKEILQELGLAENLASDFAQADWRSLRDAHLAKTEGS